MSLTQTDIFEDNYDQGKYKIEQKGQYLLYISRSILLIPKPSHVFSCDQNLMF